MKQQFLNLLKRQSLLSLPISLGAFILLSPNARAQGTQPDTCVSELASGVTVSPIAAHIGDTIFIQSVDASESSLDCGVTNTAAWLVLPDNASELIFTNGSIAVSQCGSCPPGGLAACVAPVDCVGTATYTYVVAAGDEGKNLNFTIPAGFPGAGSTLPLSGTNGYIQFFPVASGYSSSGSGAVRGTGVQPVLVLLPSLSITKICDSNCFPYGAPITFHGTVCNTGNDTLTNVTVVDTPGATITFAATTSLGNPFLGLLGSNECVNFTGSYQPTNNFCGPFPDTIIASGTDGAGVPGLPDTNFVAATVFATNSATCTVCINPCLFVTKNCATAIAGTPQLISGVVSNCGDVPITNVLVTDNIVGAITNIALLTNGQSVAYSTTIIATCGTNTDYVIASGLTACGAPISASATNNCVGTESPCITVTKTCSTAVVGQPQTISGAVTNCGNVTLTNIVVADNVVGSITNLSSLAPGAFFFYSKTVTAICGGNTNVVTASAVSVPCGTIVAARATNTCVTTEIPCVSVTSTCTSAVVGSTQIISGTVTNCGNDILSNIVVSDSLLGSITNFTTLAPSNGFSFSATLTAVCGGNTNIVTASAISQCGTPVSAMSTNTCVTTESPCITVTKTCTTAVVGQPQTISGAVTNCGNVTLTNISVSDNIVGSITNGVTLAPGGFFFYSKTVTAVCGGNTNVVTASAVSFPCGTPVSATATNTCITIESPCIGVTSACSTAVVGGTQIITGVVTNCGNDILSNIVVTDSLFENIITNFALLPPGGTFTYSNVLTAVCGGNSNVVTASAISQCGTPVSASSTNVCVTTESPCITVTKTCTTAVVGQPQTISGAVTNCGNVALTNISVSDNIVGSITNVSLLPARGFFLYSKTVTATCGGNTNIVTASAVSFPCGTAVSAEATNTCVTTESPCVGIASTCTPAIAGQPQTISGTVTNCGNDTLTNIVVEQFGPPTVPPLVITNAGTLPPGGSFTFSRTFTADCVSTTNIVGASGVSICGTPVSADSTNVCAVTQSPCITVTKTCTTALVGQPQTISGAVTNCGNVTLTNISVSDNIVGSITNGVTLAPGGFFLYSKTVTAVCGDNTNVVTASALSVPCGTVVSAMATNTCITIDIPCIAVFGNCSTGVCATGIMQLIGGVVTNCGNVTLTNVTVTDSLIGGFTNVALLPPGGSFVFTNELPTICGTTNIVTISAVSICGTPVSAEETNECASVEIPCITVTKECSTAVVGQPQTISGVVSNCGNVTLLNISVTDNTIGSITNGITLIPGGFLSYSKTVAAVCGGNTDVVTAAGISICGTSVSAMATNTCFATESPCITVAGSCSTGRSCSCPTAIDVQLIGGAVTNCGNVTLTNVTVTDSLIGTLTNVHLLAPGASFVFTNEISTLCGGSMNIVTASGVSLCGTPVSASETNMCATTEIPCITVTKDCSVVTCSNTTVSGTVTDCGNVTLTNIVVTDNLFGTITNISSLAPNSSIAFSISAMVTNTDMNGDFITAVGTTICGTPVGATASNDCVLQLPNIGITKQVACFLGANDEGSETCGVFSNSVVAISSDTQNPAFCYAITITNPGPFDLDNISIVDTNPAAGTGFGDLTAEFPCITPEFPIGASCTYTFKAQLGSDLTNFVSITGYDPSGQSVEAQASAIATVYRASVSCLKQYTIDGGPLTNNANLSDQNPHTIVWYATISNPSTNVNLADVILTDVTTNLGCSITLPPFSVDAGSNIRFALCTNVITATSDSFAITNTIRVTADEFSLGTNHLPVCAHDLTGSNIVVSSECQALLTAASDPGCPPVTKSLVSSFDTTSINTTNDLWFNANLTAKGVPASGATVFLNNAQLTITSKNGNFNYVVPNAEIIFSPGVTCATTIFDGTQWVTTVPIKGSSEVLLTALGIQAPADLKSASVTFSGGFSANTTGISLKWKWGAAVYATDMTQPQYNNLGVKPAHTKACPYNNTDHAGTPENVKHLVVRGARGGGGKNFTGSFSGAGAVTLCP